MADLLRGENRWADIEPASLVVGHEQGNRRPVLILSNDRFNARSQLVIAAAITSRGANRPIAVRIKSVQMPQESWVLPEQVRTLSHQRIGTLVGTMSESELEMVLRAIFLIIGP